jgi:hypothetical protein
MSQPIDGLKAKLDKLEQHLQALLESTQEDLEIARHLQKLLMPNRLPEIHGLKCLARYISAHDLAAESFDIVAADNKREVWMVLSWTSSFGLGSVLLQSLINLKANGLFKGGRDNLTPEEAFDEITQALTEAQKKATYRLGVLRLDMNSLKLKGCFTGLPPMLYRPREKSAFGNWAYAQPEQLIRNPKLLERADSQNPVTSAKAYRWEFQLPPGSRFFLLGKEWNPETNLETWMKPLSLTQPGSGALLEDLNQLLMRAEDHMKQSTRKADLTALAFELDSRVLHLA